MDINKSGKKYFLCKVTDELITVNDLSIYGVDKDYLYLPQLISNLQVKNNEEISITSEEIVGTDDGGTNLWSGVMSSNSTFPTMGYRFNNEKSMDILIFDFDIIFNEVIENENYLKIKIDHAYNIGVNAKLFNKAISGILDEDKSLKLPFKTPISHMDSLISNSENNEVLQQILTEVNRSILEVLSQIRDQFNIEFYISDGCFSHITYVDKRDHSSINKNYYNLFDEYEMSGTFKEITNEKDIKSYLVKHNFK
ncbi:hypothetical protein [Staphylococcus phage vB_StaM_SA1]|nr:hypothetical protein [Staphylococcus phage vB_StaM_SA1]